MHRVRRRSLPLLAATALGYEVLDPLEVCNGSPKLCRLALNEVTFAGQHNAEALRLEVKAMRLPCATDDHRNGILGALSLGMRFFDIDTCMMDEFGGHHGLQTIYSCHGPAVGRNLSSVLADTKLWLELPENRREVVVLSFAEAIPENDLQESREAMATAMVPIVEYRLGQYMLRPSDRVLNRWPTLGWMVRRNKRVVVLWGMLLWHAMDILDRKGHQPSYTQQHFRAHSTWTSTWNHNYGKWNVHDLKEYLVSYCETAATQPLIIVDAYLGVGFRREQPAFGDCNKDMASSVNPEVLSDNYPADSPLVKMQQRCWQRGRQVSMIMMDYASQFGTDISVLASAMNERNFARFGWVGGIAELGPRLFDLPGSQQERSTEDLGNEGFRDLLAMAATVEAHRINVDQVRRSRDWNTQVVFTVKSTDDHEMALTETSNTAILAKLKACVAMGSIGGLRTVRSDCGDPGHPEHGSRVPDPHLGFAEGAVVTFSCDFGYEALGNNRRTCGDDGLYTGFELLCRPVRSQWHHARLALGLAVAFLPVCLCLSLLPLCRCLQHYVQLKAFRIVFSELDRSGSGTVQKDELAEVLDRMDAKRDGQVDFDEFVGAIRKAPPEGKPPALTRPLAPRSNAERLRLSSRGAQAAEHSEARVGMRLCTMEASATRR